MIRAPNLAYNDREDTVQIRQRTNYVAMKLTKYCSLVLSVFSDALSWNRQLNANEQHLRLQFISRPPINNIVSARCLGKECSLEQLLWLEKFHPRAIRSKKQLTRQFYIRRMRS